MNQIKGNGFIITGENGNYTMSQMTGGFQDIDRVVQYRVKEGSEIPANVGPIGPQIDLEINMYLPGGPNQIEMLMGREKMKRLEIIGIRNIEY